MTSEEVREVEGRTRQKGRSQVASRTKWQGCACFNDIVRSFMDREKERNRKRERERQRDREGER